MRIAYAKATMLPIIAAAILVWPVRANGQQKQRDQQVRGQSAQQKQRSDEAKWPPDTENRVETPDGIVHIFPAGTSEAVARAAIKKYLGIASPGPEQEPPPGYSRVLASDYGKAVAEIPTIRGKLDAMAHALETLQSEIYGLQGQLQDQAIKQAASADVLLGTLDSLEPQIKSLQALNKLRALDDLQAEQRVRDLETISGDVGDLKTFRERLCSAIKFSLAEHGTSATPSGGELWSACN